jgi:hypothetical protein
MAFVSTVMTHLIERLGSHGTFGVVHMVQENLNMTSMTILLYLRAQYQLAVNGRLLEL